MTTWTIPQLTDELKKLTPWGKRMWWWPTERWVLQDPVKRAFCREAFRLSSCVGLGVHPTVHVDTDTIDAAIATITGLGSAVRWCISAQPYHYVAGSEFHDSWGAEHQADLDYFSTGLRKTLQEIKTRQAAAGMGSRKVGMLWLDTERSDLQANGDAAHDTAAAAKFSAVYTLAQSVCQQVLGYAPPITWYGHRAMDLHGNWRNASQTPPGVSSACANPVLYQFEDPHLCVETYNRTLASLPVNTDCCPAFSLVGGFRRVWGSWENAQHNLMCETTEYPRLNSWMLGRGWQFSGGLNNDEWGKFAAAPYAFHWPGVLQTDWRYWPLHFVAFANGCVNRTFIPEGEMA